MCPPSRHRSAGYSRQLDAIWEHHFPADSVSPTSLGFPSYIEKTAQFQTLPYVVVGSTTISAGARAGFEPLGYNGDGTNYSDSFQLYGNIVKIRGNHSLKAGADARLYRWSAYTLEIHREPTPSPAIGRTARRSAIPPCSARTLHSCGPNSGSLDSQLAGTVQSSMSLCL